MRKLMKFVLALLPAILVFIMILKDPFYSLDTMLCDVIYSRMNGTGDEIKLIRIDEETLAEYGPFSAWSREKSAELIELLYADKENAPAVVAFDVMFVGNADEKVDKKLAEAAAKADNLILASNLVYRGKTFFDEDGVPYYNILNIENEERPYSELEKNAVSGYANVELARDGFVRTAQIYTQVDGKLRYSFANQIYRAYVNSESAKNADARFRQVYDRGLPEKIQFFFSGKPGEMPGYSMKDVLNGEVPPMAFKDSIIIVGAYAPGLQDSYHTAANRSKDMYGVEINANIVRALMLNKLAQRASVIWLAIICAIVIFAYTYLAREMRMYPALLMGLWVLLADGIIGRILADHGKLISLVYMLIAVLIVMGWVIIEKYVLELIKKKKVLDSFRKYMAPQVIDNISKDEVFKIELGGQKRHVAVLFVDIRGFTTMSESMDPETVVQILNQYLSLTTKCIFENGGMLDKFIGDATMAIFNAPNDQEDYIYKAVLAGLAMQQGGRALAEKLEKEYGRSVTYGIGINAGDAVVGNIGSETRMDYTAIGDTVNTAARIESKAPRGEVLISEVVYEAVKDRIDAEFKEAMQLKGKAEPVKVYKVIGIKEARVTEN